MKILNNKLEEYTLVFSLSLLITLVVMQVFFRFVINFSFGWSEELARYLLIWIAWIAASYAVQQNAHIRVEILKDMLKGKVRQGLELVVLIISLSFAVFLAVEGTKFVLAIQSSQQVSPSLGIDMWVVYLAVPIGGLLMGFRFVQQITYIFRPKKEVSE